MTSTNVDTRSCAIKLLSSVLESSSIVQPFPPEDGKLYKSYGIQLDNGVHYCCSALLGPVLLRPFERSCCSAPSCSNGTPCSGKIRVTREACLQCPCHGGVALFFVGFEALYVFFSGTRGIRSVCL